MRKVTYKVKHGAIKATASPDANDVGWFFVFIAVAMVAIFILLKLGEAGVNLKAIFGLSLLVVVAVLAYKVSKVKQPESHMRKMCGYLDGLDGFETTCKIIADDEKSGMAIDDERRNICLITFHNHNPIGRILSYKDLMSSELFEDGVTLTKTSRTSQVAGALVGSALLGGVGAIIGGLSGRTESSIGKVNRIDFRLLVNDTSNPSHEVCFLAKAAMKNSPEYTKAIREARHWQGLMEVLIKRADEEDSANQKAPTDSVLMPTTLFQSLADEIKKLAELRDSGVLTAEEFQQQKNKLLAT